MLSDFTRRSVYVRRNVRKIASDFEWSNALTELSVIKTAFDVNVIKCTDEIVWLSDCCIWSWNNQMHADDCLWQKFVDQTFFAMKRLLSDCRANKLLIWCQKNCIWFRTIRCTGEVVWCLLMLQTDWLAAKQAVDSIKILTRCIWSIYFADLTTKNLIKRNEFDSYKTF